MKLRFLPLLLLPALGIASFSSPFLLFADSSFPEKMGIGESIELPEKTLTYEGESQTVKAKVISPSGGSYSGAKLTASENGIYQVVYEAYFGGHLVEERYKIRVDYRACDLFSGNGFASASLGAFSYDESIRGVKATFKNNGVLSYKLPVDMSKLPSSTPIVSFIIDPSSKDSADFSTFNIQITDAYDESNYVTINCVDSGTKNTYGEAMYVKAGAAGQTLYGYETDKKRHSDPSFGSAIKSSFRAISRSGEYHAAEFYFDYEQNTIKGYPNHESSPRMRQIVDLDSKADHPSDPFKGFSTSLVYLSFEAKNFAGGEGNVIFTSIAGSDLTTSVFVDEEKPSLNVDIGEGSSIPDAVLNRPYKLFEATSFDAFDGDLEPSCKVYYLPSEGQKIDVEIEDGYFVPKHLGDYQIVYSVSDRFLNAATLSFALYCSKSTYKLIGTLDVKRLECEVYSSVSLPSFDDFQVSGGSGAITKSRIVIDPSGNVSSLDKDAFTPEEVGTYLIRYQAFDYLGQAAIADIKLQSKNITSPLFLDDISLPVALSLGEKISLPLAKAVKPGESGPLDCLVDIYVNDEKLDGNVFVASGSEAKIVYDASGVKKEFTLPVIDLGKGSKQENYLYGKGSSSVNEKDVTFVSSSSTEVTFVRKLMPSSCSLSFSLPNMNEGESMKVNLSDGANEVSLALSKAKGNYSIASPSGDSSLLTLDTDSSIYLSYDNASRKISDGSGLAILSVSSQNDGSSFSGFEDDITLSFSLSSGKSISLGKINNQTFGKRGRKSPIDEIGPDISFGDMPSVKQALGATVILPSAKVYDVLSEIASSELTLVKPDKTKVSLDPSVDNSITFDQFGSYRLEYSASDVSGNESSTIRLFRVYETNPPSVSLGGEMKESYALGEEIKLPSYEVSDDSSSYALSFILLTPDYQRIVLLKDEDGFATYYLDDDSYASYRVSSTSFKLEEAGQYTLLISVRDQFYNLNYQKISFSVKGAS